MRLLATTGMMYNIYTSMYILVVRAVPGLAAPACTGRAACCQIDCSRSRAALPNVVMAIAAQRRRCFLLDTCRRKRDHAQKRKELTLLRLPFSS